MTDDGHEVLFLPTSPNITTGYVVEVEPSELIDLDENAEDALTRVLSGGFCDANHHGIDVDISTDEAKPSRTDD